LGFDALTALTEVNNIYSGFSPGLDKYHNMKAYGGVEVALYSL
jgi:hypothetical protein